MVSPGRALRSAFFARRANGFRGWSSRSKWLGLKVRDHCVVDAERAEVEFVARYRVGGKGVRLHERIRFVREAGCWYDLDGDVH